MDLKRWSSVVVEAFQSSGKSDTVGHPAVNSRHEPRGPFPWLLPRVRDRCRLTETDTDHGATVATISDREAYVALARRECPVRPTPPFRPPPSPGRQYPSCDTLATTLGSVSPGLHRGVNALAWPRLRIDLHSLHCWLPSLPSHPSEVPSVPGRLVTLVDFPRNQLSGTLEKKKEKKREKREKKNSHYDRGLSSSHPKKTVLFHFSFGSVFFVFTMDKHRERYGLLMCRSMNSKSCLLSFFIFYDLGNGWYFPTLFKFIRRSFTSVDNREKLFRVNSSKGINCEVEIEIREFFRSTVDL